MAISSELPVGRAQLVHAGGTGRCSAPTAVERSPRPGPRPRHRRPARGAASRRPCSPRPSGPRGSTGAGTRPPARAPGRLAGEGSASRRRRSRPRRGRAASSRRPPPSASTCPRRSRRRARGPRPRSTSKLTPSERDDARERLDDAREAQNGAGFGHRPSRPSRTCHLAGRDVVRRVEVLPGLRIADRLLASPSVSS